MSSSKKIQVTMPTELYKKLHEQAVKESRSDSSMVVYILRQSI